MKLLRGVRSTLFVVTMMVAPFALAYFIGTGFDGIPGSYSWPLFLPLRFIVAPVIFAGAMVCIGLTFKLLGEKL